MYWFYNVVFYLTACTINGWNNSSIFNFTSFFWRESESSWYLRSQNWKFQEFFNIVEENNKNLKKKRIFMQK